MNPLLLLIPLLLVSYTKDSVMVPMRDGTRLNTNVYTPDDTSGLPLPVVMMRTPYGADAEYGESGIRNWTDTRGYILVVQDMRGRYESEGTDSVFLADGWRYGKLDGYDAVEWLAQQPWCDGRIGSHGGSARGITQYLLAGAAHPQHVCAKPQVGAFDFYAHAAFPGGEYRQYDVDGWLNSQGIGHMRYYYYDHYTRDSTWDYLDVRTRQDSVAVPMFHYGGWYDLFSEGTVEGFQALRHNGEERLLMGPWTHGLNAPGAGELTYPFGRFDSFWYWEWRWYDYWLKGTGSIDHIPPVTYYLMGPVDSAGFWNNWYSADDWPPAGIDTFALYLREGGGLTFSPPGGEESPAGYSYDPADPVRTIGGNNLSLPRGPYDQDTVWHRDDVVRYVSAPLDRDVVIKGKTWVRLYASSDRVDTDFTAKLVDIYPDGRKMLVQDGILMARHRLGYDREDFLTPDSVHEFRIDLGNTAYCFPAGRRIGIGISSSNWPRFKRNLNTGAHPFYDTSDALVAFNTIEQRTQYPSRFVFEGEVSTGIAEPALPVMGRPHRLGFAVFDVLGRRIPAARTRADLAGLPPGCYVVRENGSSSKYVRVR